MEQQTSIYDFIVKTMDGGETSLDSFKGKILLIVNVASQCGFTKQYEGLENLYKKYKDRDFVVLGFPCNQFAHQEPGTDKEIRNFCTTNYQITFPLFSKIEVNGPNAHPLYIFLKEREKGILGTKAIKWNFTKFLVNATGDVLKRYAPQTTPTEIEKELKNIL